MRSEPGPVVTGYRLIELLSVGERANVFLARCVGGAGAGEEGEEVVLKVRLVRGRHAEGAGQVEVLDGWREPELELEPGPGGSADRAARATGRESEEDERVTGSGSSEWWTWEEEEVTGPGDDRREPSVAEAIDPALEAVAELVRVVRRRVRGSRRALLATPRRKMLAGGVVAAVVVVAAACGAMPGGDAAGSGLARASASGSAPAGSSLRWSDEASAAVSHASSPPTGTASAESSASAGPVEAATRDVEKRGARLEEARVVEDLGGAVVVGGTVVEGAPGEETTKPVSLLVVRSETGWVVRAVDAWRDDPG